MKLRSMDGRASRAPEKPARDQVRTASYVQRRTARPANDNALPVTHFLERTAVWLVPVVVFGLLAFAVVSAG